MVRCNRDAPGQIALATLFDEENGICVHFFNGHLRFNVGDYVGLVTTIVRGALDINFIMSMFFDRVYEGVTSGYVSGVEICVVVNDDVLVGNRVRLYVFDFFVFVV